MNGKCEHTLAELVYWLFWLGVILGVYNCLF